MNKTTGNSAFTTIMIINAPNLNSSQSFDIRRKDFFRNCIVINDKCKKRSRQHQCATE